MNKIKTVLLCLISIGLFGHACKKEPVDSKLFVERYLVGTWLVKERVRIHIKNTNDTILKDTIPFLPQDTLIYTSNGQYFRKNIPLNFIVDELGENIIYDTPNKETWRIKYARKSALALTNVKTEKIGNDTFTYNLEELLSKK